ncbi:PLP-dependent transferase [Venustampulla echinocandica]|uniref:PLP-dependent transferase n=1 Tax=Venustampulla echinocandica TaxID=2656787 RepID=A0A370TPS6_9HELO|nr:PLP-dependent transferase [Venustampulla echinocandica]RDL37531.1 PLP-dependent transferase [Venustampulla echinocandica]
MADFVSSSYTKLRDVINETSNDALPPVSSIVAATKSLPAFFSPMGLGEEATQAHLLSDICPGFNGPKTSANYYGFVTGGVFPIAEVADNIVTAFDQNVQVHLPNQSISTIVEGKALEMVVELLRLGKGWDGRTFTTGATGSNILGLACGREAVVKMRLEKVGEQAGPGELGLLAACSKAGIKNIQVLTTMGHSSLYKAASVVGLGRASVKEIPVSSQEPWRIDLDKLESELKLSDEGIVSIVALSAGEVNTGRFSTDGLSTMRKVRALCDRYGAWLHADGAFGLFARSLPATPEFQSLIDTAAGLELVDSLAGDCHKMLNVPYDCGVFITRSSSTLSLVFQNPNAAYLSSGPSDQPSPLNIGLENSRRFRALPVYAVLLAYGQYGLGDMFARQVRLARAVSEYLDSSDCYELLPSGQSSTNSDEQTKFSLTHIIVLFRAKNDAINEELVTNINATRKMYVSGTKWEGKPACRIAVSTWKVDVERDSELVKGVLEGVLNGTQ